VPKSPADEQPRGRAVAWLEQRLDLDQDETASFLFEVARLFLDRT